MEVLYNDENVRVCKHAAKGAREDHAILLTSLHDQGSGGKFFERACAIIRGESGEDAERDFHEFTVLEQDHCASAHMHATAEITAREGVGGVLPVVITVEFKVCPRSIYNPNREDPREGKNDIFLTSQESFWSTLLNSNGVFTQVLWAVVHHHKPRISLDFHTMWPFEPIRNSKGNGHSVSANKVGSGFPFGAYINAYIASEIARMNCFITASEIAENTLKQETRPGLVSAFDDSYADSGLEVVHNDPYPMASFLAQPPVVTITYLLVKEASQRGFALEIPKSHLGDRVGGSTLFIPNEAEIAKYGKTNRNGLDRYAKHLGR